ncbi:hypothetical protein [Tianweitania sp.]|uniref:hypothetical protein n=1 Tax=Tianweitania sp. TaxID=2021634 RepID=UPI00289FCC32|nr:hypothetical protein [Tianweitania sp.]
MADKETLIRSAEVLVDGDQAGEKANIAPATDFNPSGAPAQTSDIDADHPAVDNDPRAGTTVKQNQIDFNDPRPDKGSEAVAKALTEQGVPTKVVEGGKPADPLDHDGDGKKGGSKPKSDGTDK